jgi:ribose-phosphate pyrophosphokinase
VDTCFILFREEGGFGSHWLAKEGAEVIPVSFRSFSDGESYLKLEGEVKNREVAVLCSLDQPDTKAVSLFFLSALLRESGASRIGLIAPYLAYLRHDRVLEPGEAPTSAYFAKLVSYHFDWMITVDPHLRQMKSLSEIYRIPTEVVHSAPLIAGWISKNVSKPILIGPDGESQNWVASVARQAGLPSQLLQKDRRGIVDVEVARPHLEKWRDYTPVIVDDIVSSGKAMIETVAQVRQFNLAKPVCIAVHPIFSGNSYNEIVAAGAERIVSCNTISHESSGIDVSSKLMEQAVDIGFIV